MNALVDVTSSARGVLAGEEDDGWRRCLNEQTGHDVPCNRPHTAEYVATGSKSRATLDECTAAANHYSDNGLRNNTDLLESVPLAGVESDPNEPRCVIRIRGTQYLNGSLRALGVNAVPIVH